MGYTLDQMSKECHDAMVADSGAGGREKIRQCVEKACSDSEFVSTHFGPENTTQRQVLYEDSDFGFCILAHVYEGARESNPHDHGPSWAIYGQAEGVTVMTDWRKVQEPADGAPGKVEKVKSYDMTPGIAHYYAEGVLHSPSRAATTRLIRIEGKNMDGVKRDAYEVA